ncbi:uncharacterized protein PHALS_08341 [Plasmopara halstedii]|uniref:Uncharacterized protein n=1 Tax=Plasmopara halstedii TaxID=4781 RepID=A0A0P1ACS4_PLAHL|nr:uncharacterized protein PHALS_08341 [Plasmopara halstedii]CEG38256.1 hypothetical protein PHALS_08341 [Plasmopara halstedii]|eukprot:XP_024574625.1 hypothetical protein PHALS_08341 [Plasmopara halstedii]
MKEEKDADADRLRTRLFLDWFNSLKSDEDVLNQLRRSGLDINSVDSCYESFKEFCTNKAELIKSNLSENQL